MVKSAPKNHGEVLNYEECSLCSCRRAGGCRAAVRIPFAALGFDPIRDPSLRFMAMVSYSQEQAGSRNLNYSLGGSPPHTPVSWTPLKVESTSR